MGYRVDGAQKIPLDVVRETGNTIRENRVRLDCVKQKRTDGTLRVKGHVNAGDG
jgi:hypothetical protein